MQHNFRELKIWKDAIEIVKLAYSLSKKLPDNEKFGLVSQINRCLVSIPSNIAEGAGRTTEKEFIYFLNISISSSYELETQLVIIKDLFDIPIDEIIGKLNALQKMIYRFKKTLT